MQQELQQQEERNGQSSQRSDQGQGHSSGSAGIQDSLALLDDDDELIDITENIRGTLEISPDNIPCNSEPPDSSHVRISIATGVTAHWQRKDDKASHRIEPPPSGDGDSASVSTDSMILFLEEDDLKDSLAGGEPPPSQPAVEAVPSNRNVCLVSCDQETASQLAGNIVSIQSVEDQSICSNDSDDVPLIA